MSKTLTEWLVKPLLEGIELDVEVGDTILMGRFKNKRVKVKSIDYNDRGDLLINGRPALKFRIEKQGKKLLPQKTTDKDSTSPDGDMRGVKKFTEAPRVPRKKGQHRNSSSHSDLYTDENPKGTIKGLKFATVEDAEKSVRKIKNSGKTHAHKIQAAVAMEQRAKEMGKKSQAAVYRRFINSMKKKTKKENDDSGQLEEKAKRDYKAEYRKFQSSKKMKKYRAELNKYNRQKGTYGNGDKKDASHKNGKIAGYEDQSKNRGRREKSRLKKEINENKITLSVPSDIKKIYKLFKKNGKELYVVGGAVRDAILGKRPKDFDLATNAKPDEVLKIAKKGGMKTYEVGKQFGVVVVGGHEIATFRKDIGKGRRPKAVDFSDIQGDVKRRDLTINSLFFDIGRGEVVDLTGGLQDLKDKIIRTVGVAKQRFDEDPLRKLRALRFQVTIGGKMDKDTEKALIINPSLKGISSERIRDEVVKSLKKAKSQKLYMELLDKFKMTAQVFPQLNIQKPYPNVKDYIVFLATIFRNNDVSKLPKILNKLKYSGEEVKNITFLVYMNNFKPQNIYNVKKAQEKTTLTPSQITIYGKLIGKDFKKFVNFNLSVKGGGEEFKGLKGQEIGNKIKDMEKKLYMGEGVINEVEPKFRSVHTTSSFEQTFGGWYSNYVPLSTKFMQKMIGKERVSVFHVGSADSVKDIESVGRIVGKKSSLSTFTAVDKGEKLAKGQGIQTKGGIIYQLEGTLLVASTRDIQSTPDKTGRRWVPPYTLAGKVAGGKMYDEVKAGIKKNKMDRDTWRKIEYREEDKWEKKNPDYNWREKEAAMKKIMGPLKRKWIKKYIDMCYKIMRKYQPQIKRHILSQKDKGSEFGWNEIVVNQIHIQDVFLLSRENYPIIKKAAEKVAKGKLTIGSPSQFRKWYNQRGGIINESFIGLGAGDVPSPSRKMVKKMKRKGNTSVPYGSGYKKVNEQDKKIKKVIGIYGGRFQPFGPHHFKTYKWLKSQVDDVYITTSDIKKPPRHPMNFGEKIRHMTKMGVPKNKIVKEKTPYVANNALKKFDPETTAVVYIFGAKDAGRLVGGTKKSGGKTYYQDFKKNKKNLEGYEQHGYILTAPHQSIKVGGQEVSGTVMRNLLGSPKIKDDERPKLFKQAFGYYDKGVYNMMTNKFRKLFEMFDNFLINNNISEILKENSTTNLFPIDDGPPTFYDGFGDYKRHSKKWIDSMYKSSDEGLGWELVHYILGKNANDPGLDFTTRMDKVPTVAYGRRGAGPYGERFPSEDPIKAYKKWLEKVIGNLDFEVIKWFGLTDNERDVTGVPVEAPALPGVQTQDQNTQRAVELDLAPGDESMGDAIDDIQESFMKDVNLLIEGGAYGHMSHPFDDNNLTFSDLKQIVINGLGGKLDREDGVTEKLDGQNLMVCWIDGKLKAARNKGHLKNFGKTAPDTKGVKSIFKGRGNIEKAFVGAMRDLEKSIGSLSDKQKEKIFGNGKRWMNLEVMYPATANVVDYDVAEIVFHGTLEYDESGRPIGQPKDSARMLAGMIKQTNNHIQKMFKIGKPNFLTVPKVQDFGKKKNMYLGKIKKLQSQYALSDKDTLGMYHESYWREYVYNASKQFKVKLKPIQFAKLVKRWAYFDKSYKIPQMKKDFSKNEKFLDWILKTDKFDHNKIFKDNIKPFEILFFQVGAEILKNISGYMAVNPDKTIQKMRKEVISAMKDLQKPDKIEKLKKLKLQIEKLQKIGGLNAIVPSEGIVFKYKGKVYKFTGAFAPINQILGSIKFG